MKKKINNYIFFHLILIIFISQINYLLENIDKPSKPLEISIVLDGGAFNGGYLYGALLYLKGT